MKLPAYFRWSIALAACAALTGCGDNAPPIAPFDSAPLPGVDAAQLADAPQTADAPASDGGVDAVPADAGSPDAMPEPVTVFVFDNGVRESGIPVVFLNPDNSVVLETTTDVNGSASAIMPLGGSVTALDAPLSDPLTSLPNLYTFLDVQAGAQLFAGNPYGDVAAGVQISVTVPIAAQGAQYRISSNCLANPVSTSTLTTSITLTPNCSPSASFLVEATLAGTDQLGSIFNADVDVAGGDITITGAYAAVTTATLTTNDLGDNDFVAVQFAYGLGTHGFALGQGVLTNEVDLNNIDTSASAEFTVATVSDDSAGYFGAMTARKFDGASVDEVFLNTSPEDFTFDFSQFSLPTIEAQHSVSATGLLTWDEIGNGDAATTEAVTNFTANTLSFDWHVAGPHLGTSLQLPTLPSDLDQFNVANTTAPLPRSIAITNSPWETTAGLIFFLDFHSPQFLSISGESSDFAIDFSYNEGFFCPEGFHLDRTLLHGVHPC